jgi:ribosome maturation factor RimP
MIDPRVRGLIEEVTERYGVELVELEMFPAGRRRILRLYIDQPGGVTHKDCAFVSRKVSELLDQKEALPFAYDLEVSSPGINRPLTQPEHFERFVGEQAELELKAPRDGRRNFKGRIDGVSPGALRISLLEGDVLELPFEDIQRARLSVDPWEQHRKGRDR